MKQFKHVYRMGKGFVFRLALPNCRFVSAEVYDTEDDAAFYADVFKLHLATTYHLTGSTMDRSLPPKSFSNFLAFHGGDAYSLLPSSCHEYLMHGGHEFLTAFAAAWADASSRRFTS